MITKEPDDCVTYGDFMRYARESRNMTQRELAERAGIYCTRLTMWENGECTPRLDLLVALADALHISIDEYIGRKVSE